MGVARKENSNNRVAIAFDRRYMRMIELWTTELIRLPVRFQFSIDEDSFARWRYLRLSLIMQMQRHLFRHLVGST